MISQKKATKKCSKKTNSSRDKNLLHIIPVPSIQIFTVWYNYTFSVAKDQRSSLLFSFNVS